MHGLCLRTPGRVGTPARLEYPVAGAAEWAASAESPVGHLAASRTDARGVSSTVAREMPGGLPDRDSCDGLAEPRVVDNFMSNPETLGADDTQLQL